MFVHEQVQHFGERDGGMRVVKLHRPFLAERRHRPIQRAMGPNHALQRAAHEEILLLQAQDLTLGQLVAPEAMFSTALLSATEPS